VPKAATLVSKKLTTGGYTYNWEVSGYVSGLFFYKLKVEGGFMETKKLILLK